MIIEFSHLFPLDKPSLNLYFSSLFAQHRDEKTYLKSSFAQHCLWNTRNRKRKSSKRSGDVHQRIFACLYELRNSGQDDRCDAFEGVLERLGVDEEEIEESTLSVLLILLANASLDPIKISEYVP
jgi:hypothetical protein